ncbi:YMGG-like glycine zipper-containing protein [Bradyrhizobium sp.]|uniref:YMGG-like glycine zipper-containing protein n=1 Tax=Bradyrhizobium sp. TaxID=376 RepID=UPI004037E777
MSILKTAAVGILAISTCLAGCAQTPQEQRTATGAVLGAAGGALVGQAVGGTAGSTLVGAGAGALLGAAVADSTNPRGAPMCRYGDPYGRIYVAECDERYYSGRY